MRRINIGILCLILTGISVALSAQESKRALKQGESVTAAISKNESHRYQLQMDKDQFALLKIMQKGVDIIITSYNPNGKVLGLFDSPNGSNGPEYVTLLSDKAGTYELEIEPIDTTQKGGSYDIDILRFEPKAQTKPGQVDQLMSAWDNRDTPGAAIAVVEDGEISFKKGYGMSNLEYDIPITPSSIFHIASVSKQFTAFSILLLEEEGKLSLDDDIRKYIPEVPDFGNTITLNHFVHHTSGLRDQWNLLAMAGWRLDDVITKDQILKLVSRQKELNFLPGEEFLYCNTGFTLLAEVVARVSGRTFAQFTDERIFKPLQMSSTLFYDDHEKIVKNRTYSYHQDSTGLKKSVLSYANVGATSLFTTVEDLSLWAMNFEEPMVGNRAIVEKMKNRFVLNNGNTIDYALGQTIGTYKGLNMISHGGSDAGYRTFLGRFPDQRFAVVVLSNLASFNPSGIAMRIADIYLDGQLQEEQEENMRTEATSARVKIEPDTLNAYTGDYRMDDGTVISILLRNKGLAIKVTGQPEAMLESVSTTRFRLSVVDADITFLRDNDNQVSQMKINQGAAEFIVNRAEPFDPGSVDLSEFTGRYYSEELLTMYEFILLDGKLVARHQRHPDIELTPNGTDKLSGNTWFFGQVEMVRDQSGAITGCKVSSGRVRNLAFTKL
jgi:CubicO group peptidase (beta-lactamase class C family)